MKALNGYVLLEKVETEKADEFGLSDGIITVFKRDGKTVLVDESKIIKTGTVLAIKEEFIIAEEE